MPKTIVIEEKCFTVPDTIQWIARDADGTWWAYEAEPLQHHMGWYENEVGDYLKLATTAASKHWRDTLRKV